MKKPDEALKYIMFSIKQNSLDYLAFNTLGLILISLKKYDQAKKAFLEGIKIEPTYIASYNNLGHCYTLVNEKDNALKIFKKGLRIDPDSPEVINNLANYYNNNGEYEKALKYYFEAFKTDNKNSSIISNIAIAYFNLGNNKKAEKFCKKAYLLNPNDDLIKKAYSMLLLKQQKYKEAWKIFDGRLKLEEFSFKNTKHYNIKTKLWNNEKSIKKNSKILIIKEQGVGDEILYSSMYPDLLKSHPNTIFEADERLISLFDYSLNDNKKNKFYPFGAFSNDIKKLENFDTIMYAGSLGKHFRNSIANFPKTNFLRVSKKNIEKINTKLNHLNKLKIGISWRSKREHLGKFKSINLSSLLPILKIKNVDFINLQYGDTENEVKNFNMKEKTNIQTIDSIDLFNDFESIAGLLCSLDLFISVSNSTVHLAGSLGVPTWLIKPINHAAFFYWNQPSNQTPWYSSIKIFSSSSNYKATILKIKNQLVKEFNLES